MEISIVKGLVPVNGYDLVIYPVLHKANLGKIVDSSLAAYAVDEGYEGGSGEWLCIPIIGDGKARKIAFIGLGDKRLLDEDAYRRLGGQLAKRIGETNAKKIAVVLDFCMINRVPARDLMRAIDEGFELGNYSYHVYHPEQAKKRRKQRISYIHFYTGASASLSAMQRGLEEARIGVIGAHLARDLVNTPSLDMGPSHMAAIADEIAARSKRIKVKHLDRARMERLGMRAVLSVAQGSIRDPHGVHLIYQPQHTKHKTQKRIAIVGKAVTFDSGGLSIKPGDGMMTMKMDMAGGAVVLGMFRSLAELELDVEVHGIFLAVENMPSGNAYRPGDVIRAMDGTTIEILNTDAEGRVTLADALAYAKLQQPDVIIDLATLTGACITALGEEIAGIMGTDPNLIKKLIAYGTLTGEPIWELPLYPPYEEHVKSRIAQLKNIGARGQAGAIAGGMFLKRFVGDTPWAHIDIAGPAYAERETRPDTPHGGTGFGVRFLLRYLQSL